MNSAFIKDMMNYINDLKPTFEEKIELMDLLANDLDSKIEETVINGRKALIFG